MTPISGYLRPAFLACVTFLLAGCSTFEGWFGGGEPTAGDRMIAQGEATAELGEMWNEGSDLVKEADSLTREGTRLRKRGRENLEKGRELTGRARAAIEEQQRAYTSFASSMGPMATFLTARDQRNRLDQLVRDWARARKQLENGRELIEKGQVQIDEGEAKIAEADAMRLRGKNLMRRAEQSYQPSGPVPTAFDE